MKCGNCHRKSTAKSTNASRFKSPSRRDPTDQRGHGAGYRADRRRQRRALFQRRVYPRDSLLDVKIPSKLASIPAVIAR